MPIARFQEDASLVNFNQKMKIILRVIRQKLHGVGVVKTILLNPPNYLYRNLTLYLLDPIKLRWRW